MSCRRPFSSKTHGPSTIAEAPAARDVLARQAAKARAAQDVLAPQAAEERTRCAEEELEALRREMRGNT